MLWMCQISFPDFISFHTVSSLYTFLSDICHSVAQNDFCAVVSLFTSTTVCHVFVTLWWMCHCVSACSGKKEQLTKRRGTGGPQNCKTTQVRTSFFSDWSPGIECITDNAQSQTGNPCLSVIKHLSPSGCLTPDRSKESCVEWRMWLQTQDVCVFVCTLFL